MEASSSSSCILHMDLDCFYAQVEHRRLGIPSSVPLAVQQWQGLIAVNYAARDKGVTRFMRIHEALKACPELMLVHVKTIGLSGEQCEGGNHQEVQVEGSSKSRLTAKACLSRYRTASAEIIALLRSLLPECKFEKGGCDEFFFDLTSLARSRINALKESPGALSSLMREAESCCEIQGGPIDPLDETDLLLTAGAVEAGRLRKMLFDQLGYTASAGISNNKLLSKVASAKFKPNREALVLPRGTIDLMTGTKIKKIWGLGGKIGETLEENGITTAGEAMALSLASLTKILRDSEVAVTVYHKVRGESNDPVVPKSLPKSFASCKSFQVTSDLTAIRRWIDILADELATRLEEDAEEHSRRPGTLTLHYSSTSNPSGSSVRIQVPRQLSALTIASSAFESFKRLPSQSLPVIRLSLTASDFVEGPRANTKGSITSYFYLSSAKPAEANETDSTGHPVRLSLYHNVEAARRDDQMDENHGLIEEKGEEDILGGVDLDEQRRIMAEIEHQRKRARLIMTAPSNGTAHGHGTSKKGTIKCEGKAKQSKAGDIRGFFKPRD